MTCLVLKITSQDYSILVIVIRAHIKMCTIVHYYVKHSLYYGELNCQDYFRKIICLVLLIGNILS